MNVRILEQALEFTDHPDVLSDITAHIEELTQSSGLVVSHWVVDGVLVYDDYEDYIRERLPKISEVEIVVKSKKQLQDELLISLDRYLKQALPEIPGMIDRLYHGGDQEAWGQFSQLVEGLNWIFEAVYSIVNSGLPYAGIESIHSLVQQLRGQVETLAQALEHKDITFLADILHYELLTTLRNLGDAVSGTVDSGVERYELN
jgi:hypothetical protein